MGSLIKQTAAVITMNIRSLPERKWMSLATVIAVAVVVAVLLAFLAMANGFRATVAGTGSEDIAVVTRQGSQAEINSVLMRDQVNLLATAPGIKRDSKRGNNRGIISSELYVIVDGIKRSTGTEVNIPLRGLTAEGVEMRKGLRISQGRMFDPGKTEIVVGKGVLREFSGFDLGSSVRLGGTQWKVVGVFEAGGSVFESELWADVKTVQSQFNRGSSYQIVRARLDVPGDVSAIEAFAENDPQLNIDIKTEAAFYQEQSKGISDVIFYLGWPLAIIMGLGALSGALNTMYTSVAQRATEIATLRAIGFSNVSAFLGTLCEALCLAFIGGVLGTFAAYFYFDGISASTLGSGFSQVVFSFKMSAETLKQGILLAVVIGLIGGFFPAWKAARLPVVRAFA